MYQSEEEISIESHIVPPPKTPTASIIWLHGLGADGTDFTALPEQLEFPSDHGIKFLFPNAPFRPITINQGMVMRGWYDIARLDLDAHEDSSGITASSNLLVDIIEQEIKQGIEPHRIILAGFSQGGAMALYTGLRFPKKLGAILSLSAYQPLAASLDKERNKANYTTPIFLGHGLFDPVVPLELGHKSRQQLLELDYTVNWRAYPMQHTLCPEEIVDIALFLKNILLEE